MVCLQCVNSAAHTLGRLCDLVSSMYADGRGGGGGMLPGAFSMEKIEPDAAQGMSPPASKAAHYVKLCPLHCNSCIAKMLQQGWQDVSSYIIMTAQHSSSVQHVESTSCRPCLHLGCSTIHVCDHMRRIAAWSLSVTSLTSPLSALYKRESAF